MFYLIGQTYIGQLEKYKVFDSLLMQAVYRASEASTDLGECLKLIRHKQSCLVYEPAAYRSSSEWESQTSSLPRKADSAETCQMSVTSMLSTVVGELESLELDNKAYKEFVEQCHTNRDEEEDLDGLVLESYLETKAPLNQTIISEISSSSQNCVKTPYIPTKTSASTIPFKYESNTSRMRRMNNCMGSTSDTQWLYSFRSDVQRAIESVQYRQLTLAELIHYVNKFFEKKLICPNSTEHTLETYVYGFIIKKYGLRKLCVEAVATILCSADRFESSDWRVATFVRAFRNDIDEDFYVEQCSFIAEVRQLVFAILSESFPYKLRDVTQLNCSEFLSTRLIGERFWVQILKRIYGSSEETEKVAHLIRGNVISLRMHVGNSPRHPISHPPLLYRSINPNSECEDDVRILGPMSRRGYLAYMYSERKAISTANRHELDSLAGDHSVSLSMFENTVANYQLTKHLNSLKTYKAAFDAYDANSDGLISMKDFFSFCIGVIFLCRYQESPNVESNVRENENFVKCNFEDMVRSIGCYGNRAISFASSLKGLYFLLKLVAAGR